MQTVVETKIVEYPLLSRGKVRDIYEINHDTLLLVTTDRMSAFDVIMDKPIPHKGVVLNQITLFWMEKFKDLVANHLIEHEVSRFPEPLHAYRSMLEGRSVLVKKARPLPIECIVRGHISGSGWKDYLESGKICGYALPKGLQESERLAEPLFTPSTKAGLGAHDQNITYDEAKATLGRELFKKVREVSLEIFRQAREYAESKGIIIADTKFEFGLIGDELIIIDEVLTPDSSRFWPMQGYAVGKGQPSFDKQYLRDWLQTQDWDFSPPPPALPDAVVKETKAKYLDAYAKLTGKTLDLPK